MLNSACKLIASVMVDQSLVINESTSYIGTLRNLIKPTIETISLAKNISYAVAPERITRVIQNGVCITRLELFLA
jgi:UDP-N-acetyl-D-mannosaminuronate dehydrogenase